MVEDHEKEEYMRLELWILSHFAVSVQYFRYFISIIITKCKLTHIDTPLVISVDLFMTKKKIDL